MIEELIVVEGKNDAQAVRRALGAVDIIWTEGYGLTREKLQYIKEMAARRGVIVLTDPDSVGEQIRERIRHTVPEAKHVYLSKKDARSQDDKDIGVENATPEDIRRAFKFIQVEHDEAGDPIFIMDDLVRTGLTGLPDSAEKRRTVGRILGLGDTNAKQFLHRINRFRISREDFNRAIKQE
ncbi:ribonuclease M5 [Desulfitobacterium sp.]|uniref:ribonuclease M5 n=1 Tax=Desulfitobacterium sp. TaxID=49981 RepID=UPI002BE1AE15|nr:ribonuclease M5 [Desulfitobacterium sp.]HVJ50730.1 ribonuclease M5 [Desulfitobacterium sp.]